MKTIYLLLSVFIYGTLFSQTTHTVDNSPSSGAQFTSLQAAIDAATAGDTLYIHPSPNAYGNVTLTKTLHLRGIAHAAEIGSNVYAEIGTITLNAPFGAQGFTMEGLRLSEVYLSGSANYSNAIIKNCRIKLLNMSSTSANCDNWIVSGNIISYGGDGLIFKKGHDSWVVINNHLHQTNSFPGSSGYRTLVGFNSTDLIRNNILISNETDAVTICSDCASALIENSLMLFNGAALSIANSSSTLSFNHSLTYNYLGGTMEALNGNGNLDNTNPNFVNATNGDFSYGKDFHIQEGTAAHTAGSDGTQLGIYGNDYPFNMRGYPNDLPYPTMMVISNSVLPQGGTLNVSFEAESN